MKKVVVTGATGFIGRRVLPLLLERGFQVHAVSSRPATADAAVRWHHCDLLEPGQPAQLLRAVEPTHLLHLAWCTEYPAYWTSRANLDWVRVTLELTEAFAEKKGARVVVAGTCAEYDWAHGFCSEAVTPVAPSTLYGVTKDATRRIIESLAKLKNLSVAWARLFFMYGHDEHPKRLIRSVAESLLAGVEAPCSDGHQIRDFLHVDDVAGALTAIVDTETQGAINVGSGRATTVRELLEIVSRLTGNAHLLRPGAMPTRPGEVPCVLADVRLLRDTVGFRPKHDHQTGLEAVVQQLQVAGSLARQRSGA